MTEAEIIAVIREMTAGEHPGVELGIGDDAALFRFGGDSVLLTTDSLFEGIHFDLATYHHSDVGWKAAAAAVSDIAAMGGAPSCALLALAFGAPPTESEVRSLIAGLLDMLSTCHCPLVGGDVSRSADGLSLTVTVAGTPHPSGGVPRGGARPGDVIGVTGLLGDSAAGLFVLTDGDERMRADFPVLVEAHLRPRPRVLAGGILAGGGATAMEDVSDGLARDLAHICEESRVGCRIEAGAVPLSADAVALAAQSGRNALAWALSGGEDFELLFCCPPERFDELATALNQHGVAVARLGAIEQGNARVLVTESGEIRELEDTGYDHFAPPQA